MQTTTLDTVFKRLFMYCSELNKMLILSRVPAGKTDIKTQTPHSFYMCFFSGPLQSLVSVHELQPLSVMFLSLLHHPHAPQQCEAVISMSAVRGNYRVLPSNRETN